VSGVAGGEILFNKPWTAAPPITKLTVRRGRRAKAIRFGENMWQEPLFVAGSDVPPGSC
jgi:hypothetical protein